MSNDQSNNRATLSTPLAKVRGLGSAKEGVTHWWHQRLTAIALVPLTVWFVIRVLSLVGADYATALNVMSTPWSAALMLAFVLAIFYHGALGLTVVIEDYVASHRVKMLLIIAVKFAAIVLALGCVISIVKIATLTHGI